MANTLIESLFGQTRPTAGNPLLISVFMSDATGAGVASIAFGDVTCTVHKFGEAFGAFPGAFDTNNWAELGNGEYVVKFRQEDADELAFTNTSEITVHCTASAGSMKGVGKVRIAASDVARLTAAAEANFAADYDGTGYAGGTIKRQADLVSILGAAITGTGAWIVARFSAFFNVEAAGATVGTVYTGTPPTKENISTQVASDLATAHGAGSWATATGFSTLTAQQVWSYSARSLTTFGTLVADIVAAAVAAVVGSGTIPVTVTVTDGTNPIADHPVTLNSQATGEAVAGPKATDENGEVVFNCTTGHLLTASPKTTTFLSGGATNFTVGATAQAVTCAMTAAALPDPPAAGSIGLIIRARDFEGNVPVSAGAMTITVLSVDHAAALTDETVGAEWAVMGKPYSLDANGQVQFNIPAAMDGKRMRIKRTWTDEQASPKQQSDEWVATIDASKVDPDDGYLRWSACGPSLK